MKAEKRILAAYFPAFTRELIEAEKESHPKQALMHLAQWSSFFSPIVSPDEPPKEFATDDPFFYGINLDITGSLTLFRSEEEILEKLSQALTRFNLCHKIAIAPSLGSAWALSRFGKKREQVFQEDLPSALAPLPVHALRLNDKLISELSQLNIFTIKELLKLPRPSLFERFGKGILHKINQALAIEQEPINPIKVLTLSRVEKVFESIVTNNETVKVVVLELLEELLKKLKNRHLQPSQIITQLKTANKVTITRNLSLCVPTYSHKHIWRIMERKLDTVQAPFGVEKVSLIANTVERFAPTPTKFNDPYLYSNGSAQEESRPTGGHLSLQAVNADGEKKIGELVDTLIERLGHSHVLVPSANESYIPEESFSLTRYADKYKARKDKVANAELCQAERPSLLFSKPFPVRAMSALPDGPPYWLKWKEEPYEIKRAIGPERIVPEWWKERETQLEPRDYFKVQIKTGTWLWVYRELNSSHWFLHGLWA